MQFREQFLKILREGLNHLYDPAYLRRSPLLEFFHVANRYDCVSRSQEIITSAIEALKPRIGDPAYTVNRRSYDILVFRYLQMFSQQEVADQIGMSIRSLRRAQDIAVEALALHLWKKYLPENSALEGENLDDQPCSMDSNENQTESGAISKALDWLQGSQGEQYANLETTLDAVLKMVKPLAQTHHVEIIMPGLPPLKELSVHPVALRQILINLLNPIISLTHHGQVTISVHSLNTHVEIKVRGVGSEITPALISGFSCEFELVQQLVELSRGTYDQEFQIKSLGCAITLPVVRQIPVLVVDDHADTLELLERYVSGTPYHLATTRDPEQALPLAEKIQPQVIILDVMMAPIDGLEVLGRLRQHPMTGHLPILVCTILPQRELVLSMGASAYLRKPVNRSDFLKTLEGLVQDQEEKPH